MSPRSQLSNADGRMWFLAWALRLVTLRTNLRSAINRAALHIAGRLDRTGGRTQATKSGIDSGIDYEDRAVLATSLVRRAFRMWHPIELGSFPGSIDLMLRCTLATKSIGSYQRQNGPA